MFIKDKSHDKKTSDKEITSEIKKENESISTLFHELRNLLQGVLGHAELTKEGISKLIITEPLSSAGSTSERHVLLSSLKSYSETIIQCTLSQKKLIDEVLDFAKLSEQKTELVPSTFYVMKNLLHDIITMYKALTSTKKILFVIDAPETDTAIFADSARIKQILMNLLSNALKFTPSGGEIYFSAKIKQLSDKEIQLNFTIKDTGIGLTCTQATKLFQPYVQADASIYKQFGGTGLGLAICKQLIHLMHGTINYVKQDLNKGCQFDVSLPCLKAPADMLMDSKLSEKRNNHPQIYEKDQPPRYSHVILVVDDNDINLSLLFKGLTSLGCLVDLAQNGKIAAEKALVKSYDIIFMDINMDVMDGLEATHIIREQEKESPHKTKIIGLSGNASKEDRDIALEKGMDSYLTKPVSKQNLVHCLATYPVKQRSPRTISSLRDPVHTPYPQAEPPCRLPMSPPLLALSDKQKIKSSPELFKSTRKLPLTHSHSDTKFFSKNALIKKEERPATPPPSNSLSTQGSLLMQLYQENHQLREKITQLELEKSQLRL